AGAAGWGCRGARRSARFQPGQDSGWPKQVVLNRSSGKEMMNRMIVGNLVHRPVRSLISIVAVALEVTLILLIVGLSLGMLQDQRTRAAGIGADVIVMPPGSSFIAGLTGSPMPIKVAGILAKLPHVEKVAPVITQVSTAGTLEI